MLGIAIILNESENRLSTLVTEKHTRNYVHCTLYTFRCPLHCTLQRSSPHTVPTASETGCATSVSRHPTPSSEEEPTKHLKSKHEVSNFGTASVPTPAPARVVALLVRIDGHCI
ncbi:hypothetical protein Tco_0868189 [Tanacetum coccineum]